MRGSGPIEEAGSRAPLDRHREDAAFVAHTLVCVPPDRLTITVEPELGRAIRALAAATGVSVSAWMGLAAQDRIRNNLLGAALDEWQAEDGAFTDDELAAAAKRLGL
jgi:hypothetical protein